MARDLRRYDRLDLATTAPAPLPALEHPDEGRFRSRTIPEVPPVPASAVGLPPARGGCARRCGAWPPSGVVRLRDSAAAPAAQGQHSCDTRARRREERKHCVGSGTSAGVTSPPRSRPVPHRRCGTARSAAAVGRAAPVPSPPVRARTRTASAPAPATKRSRRPRHSTVAPAPVAPKPTGRVVFAVSPWGEIYVDGKKRGISPPTKELRLPPGKHAIEIRNGAFPPHTETSTSNPDEAVRITTAF